MPAYLPSYWYDSFYLRTQKGIVITKHEERNSGSSAPFVTTCGISRVYNIGYRQCDQ